LKSAKLLREDARRRRKVSGKASANAMLLAC
jgi:hypothetical protein